MLMQTFVGELFAQLKRENLTHKILRGSRNLRELHAGSDIDLIVAPKDAKRFGRVLRQCARTHNIRVWESFRAGFLTQFYLHSSKDATQHEFFELDLHTSEACFGVPFISATELFSDESDQLRRITNFLTPFLSGGEVHVGYRKLLLDSLNENRVGVRTHLSRIFGSSLAADFISAIEAAPNSIAPSEYRRALLARAFARRPLRSLFALVTFFCAVRIAPLMRPRGRFIALLGTDGSGKSTLAAALAKRLRPVFREGGVHEFHMRPGLLPQLRSLLTLKKKVYTEEEIANPHAAPASGRLGSLVRLGYYWLDFVVGAAVRVLPLRRRNSLVLFDRYFDDYRVDSRRARIRPGMSVPRWLAPTTPRPDVILVCTADLETVQSRKQEHSREESSRQLAAYEELAASDSRFQIINTSGTLEQSTDCALEAIFAERAA